MLKNNNVICVPSYGFRFTELFDALRTIKDYDVKIFVSNDDPNLNKYNDLGIDIINTDSKNIAEKRKFIVDWTIENGYEYAYIIEDDVKAFGEKITPETKRETSNTYRRFKVTIEEMVNVLYDKMKEHNASFGSFIRNIYLGFSKPGAVKINKSLNCGQFICYNVNDVKNNNISIYTEELIPEDVKFCMDILMSGLTCICVADYTYIEQPDKTSVVHSGVINRSMAHIRFAKMYNCPLKIDKSDIIRPVITFKNYVNGIPEYKNDVKEKYETFFKMFDNNEPYENLLNYLKTEILKK